MPTFSLGTMDREGTDAPVPLALVTAAAPDERITGVQDAGDEFFFVAVLDAISDLSFTEKAPTPFAVAVAVAGRSATVHRVLEDGTLRGWRRDYADPEMSLSSSV